MKYNFDEIIDRRNTNALNTDGFRGYIFHAGPEMQFPYADEDFVRMWVADMEFAVAPEIRDAIKARIDRRIFGYTQMLDNAYYDIFSAWCKEHYGWSFPREQLVITPGIIPALYELVGDLTAPDEKVLVTTPSYGYFLHAAEFNHRELVSTALKNDGGYFTIDFDDLEAKAADPKVRLLIWCNPHNPTGRMWTAEETKRVVEIAKKYELWLISDEIHCDLIRTGKRHIPTAVVEPDYEKLITCMAASKTFNMAGLMFSNIMIRDEGLRSVWKARHYDFENPLSIAAAQAAYEHGEEWLYELCEYLDGNFAYVQAFLKEHLPKAVYRISEATYLAWVDVSAYLPENCEFLPLYFANNAGVLLEGGNMFVANSDGYIRLNLAMPRAMLQTGMERIADLLNS